MPEQNTPTPIKYEDIQKGDRIRRTEAIEYTAQGGSEASDQSVLTYELLHRPVTPPSEPGVYLNTANRLHYFLNESGGLWCLENMDEHGAGGPYSPVGYDRDVFTLMRPVAAVASEVIEAVREQGEVGISNLYEDLSIVAAKYGVTP